jgi:hypothetical protein
MYRSITDLKMYFMVDLAGFEPASRTLFSLLHTAITYSILFIVVTVNLFGHHLLNSFTFRINEFLKANAVATGTHAYTHVS